MKNILELKDSEITLKNKIAILKFNRDDVRNALTGTKIINDIISTINFLNMNQKYSVLIITGNGSCFSSGGNIKEMRKKNSSFSGKVEEIERKYRYGIQLIPKYMVKLEIPVIAAINGPAIGAGLDLACMCDFRVMANTAFLAENFIDLGIIPGDGGAYFLQRIIGYQKAAELTFTGRRVYAEEAKIMGLIIDKFEKKDLIKKTLDFAKIIAKKPPLALRYTKRLMMAADKMHLDDFLEFSALFQGISHNQADHKIAVKKILGKK